MASRDDGGHGSVVALRPDNVSVLRPAEQLFDDMLAGWAGQQSSRLLSSKTIGTREAQVRRFAGFCAASPWEWAASDVEEWTTELLSGPRPLTPSTIRSYQNAVALFCSYLTDARYGWIDRCMELFGTHPVQVCHEWNTVIHVADHEARPAVRPADPGRGPGVVRPRRFSRRLRTHLEAEGLADPVPRRDPVQGHLCLRPAPS